MPCWWRTPAGSTPAGKPVPAPASERIALQWHDFYLALQPAAGGSVAAFTWRDQPLFRTETASPESPAEPLALAGFPLIPFASRITGNRFAWSTRRDGVLQREILLTPNMPGEPLAIHGQSWRHPWIAENTAAGGYRLTYHHEPDSWPWRYRARQTFTPHPDGFSLALELANTDRTPMPGGLGWHPYLHRGDAHLTAAERAGAMRGFVREFLPGFADGSIVPVVDRVFAFDDLPAAKVYVETNAQIGKVVVSIP